MAFNKNRKRAIGIIVSYLFGLSSSSGVFKDHSYFEPKWCDNCKHVYHKGDKSTCSHEKVNASFDDLYLQSNFVGEDGLLWFKNKKDPDKIFYIILRNKNGSKINSNLDKAYENYDFAILSKKYLEDTLKGSGTPNDVKNNYNILLESFKNAENKQGGYIDWSDKLQDNPLDNVGAYLSNGGFVTSQHHTLINGQRRPMCQTYVLSPNCNKDTIKIMLAHATNMDKKYDVLETRYNRKVLGINQDTSRGQSEIWNMREGGMLFFAIDAKDLPSQYAHGPSHFICPLSRFPIVLIEPDKGKWMVQNAENMKYFDGLYLNIVISDGKTMQNYVNDLHQKGGWKLLMDRYQTDQSPEILVPCRIFANDWNSRKWTNQRQNSWDNTWDVNN